MTIILCVFLLSCQNRAQPTEKLNYENHPSIKIINSQERTFHSEIYNHDLTLQIYLPMGYEESDSTFNKYPHLQREGREAYPVLYLLDSDVYFGMASVIARLLHWEKKLPGIIIVGISYGLSDWWGERAIDYLPFPYSELPASGEASRHLEMYEKELIPYIESNFRADASHRILFGHSSGGIFPLYALFSNPELFHGYMPASLWTSYLTEFFFDIEENYSKNRNDLPAKLFISMAALEQIDERPEWDRFLDILADRNYNYLTIKRVIIEDESHLSSAPISLIKGLQWYFSNERKNI